MEMDVPGMLDMLKPHWLNYWWHCLTLFTPPAPFYATCLGAVETILHGHGLIGVRGQVQKAKKALVRGKPAARKPVQTRQSVKVQGLAEDLDKSWWTVLPVQAAKPGEKPSKKTEPAAKAKPTVKPAAKAKPYRNKSKLNPLFAKSKGKPAVPAVNTPERVEPVGETAPKPEVSAPAVVTAAA